MVIDIIRTKRAVRQFTDQPVPEEIVRAISVSCAAILSAREASLCCR
jgi:nitroreductase